MIQSVNSYNNSQSLKQNPNFGQNRPSKAKQYAGFVGTHFVAGAVASTLIESGANLWNMTMKTGKPIVGLKEMGKRAGFLGLGFVAFGVAWNFALGLMNRGRKQ